MELNIDYGTLRPATPNARADISFASIDGRVSALGTDEVVFYDPRAGVSHVMTQQVLQALDLTREFRPLAQHVARVAEALPGLRGKNDAVQRVLESLIKRGLLISEADFQRRFATTASTEVATIAGIFVRACDRPERARRLFASLLDYERRYGARRRYVLVDDSRRAECVREHAEILRHFSEASGCVALHITPERWQVIADQLQRELPEYAQALRPLLLRGNEAQSSGGLARNLVTLLAAGQRYALLDDDFVFPLRRHPEYAPGLFGDMRGFALRTFATRDAALDAGTDTDGDPIAAHFEACGRPLAEAMSRVEGCRFARGDLLGFAPSRTPTLEPSARMVLTFNGHRGASGSLSLSWLYMLSPAERAGIAADREAYVSTHRDPSVWYGAARFVVGAESKFTPFAIDNSQLMPCVRGRGRGEDALFNALVSVFRPGAGTLDFPYAMGHAPEARPERAAQLADTFDLNGCLAQFVRHAGADAQAEHAQPRVAALCARLADLAGGSDRAIVAYINEYLAYRRSGTIQRMQMAAALEPAPPLHWLADLRARVEANGKALIERDLPRLAGWPDDADEAECARRFRGEAQELIDGLNAWPAAWNVALQKRWLE